LRLRLGPAKIGPMASPPLQPVRVWDLPTRLFHWMLTFAVIGAFVTAKIGGNAMVWHSRLGLLIGALLVFRLAWGLVGGRWSRFASFLPMPGKLLRHLRGRGAPHERVVAGHGPLGALSVFAVLAVLAVQVGTGLVSDDEIAFVGPLNRFVELDTGLAATGWHKEYGEWLIAALVALHVAAIVFYAVVRRHHLVPAMLHGDKVLPAGTPASADGWPQRLLALALASAAAALAFWVARLGG
jgi:cytochrome b